MYYRKYRIKPIKLPLFFELYPKPYAGDFPGNTRIPYFE